MTFVFETSLEPDDVLLVLRVRLVQLLEEELLFGASLRHRLIRTRYFHRNNLIRARIKRAYYCCEGAFADLLLYSIAIVQELAQNDPVMTIRIIPVVE